MKTTGLKPGWKMTEDQHRLFWRLWQSACRYQEWTAAEAEGKRHEILAELGFSSAKDITPTDGFDRVKARLEALAGRVHNVPPDAGERRRIISCIGTLLADLGEAQYPEHALNTILRKRFKVIDGANTITDLETRELVNLLRTLTARLASWKRRSARQTLCSAPAELRHDDCNAVAEDAQNSISGPKSIAKSAACYERADSFFSAG